jgi:hypothetical protein
MSTIASPVLRPLESRCARYFAAGLVYCAILCAPPLFAQPASGADQGSDQGTRGDVEAQSKGAGTPMTVRLVVGNEVWQRRPSYKASGDWLALACSAKGCVLEPASLSVKQQFWQGHYDERPTSGQLLTFKRNAGSAADTVVAWFQALAPVAWLKARSVTTYSSPLHRLEQPAGRANLQAVVNLPGGERALLVPMLDKGEAPDRNAPDSRDRSSYVLQLRAQGKRQLLQGNLGTCTGKLDPREYLLWAGDLDEDGKPDFLVSFVDAEGPVHLYLSGAAAPGQIVGLAGVYNSPPFGGECDG